jgi:hypothetical protein
MIPLSVYDSDTVSAVRLTKKLRRFFNEVRREAKRNSKFAAKLDAALDAMGPDDQEDLPDAAFDGLDAPVRASALLDPDPLDDDPWADVNPVAIARREGEEGLRAVIEGLPEMALRGLIAEHNLDPAGESARLRRDALVNHIVAQAAKRIARDKKLFEY